MATTSFQGIVRSYGGGIKGTHTPVPVTQSVQISFDPLQLQQQMFVLEHRLHLAKH